VLLDRPPAEVSQPGQRLIDPGVACLRHGRLRNGRLRNGTFRRAWPGGTAAIKLHQAALLSSAPVCSPPRVHRFSEERYRPEPTGRVTRRAGGMP
jgi:hypothetical protein